MVDAIANQHPSQSLVLQKLVTGWCMTPVKSNGKDVIESFRKGHLGEPKIRENTIAFRT
jgi:hypothetical protein